MKAEMNRQAEQYIRQKKAKSRITTVVAVLSVLVALITTYILMLPGITMEYGMVCGLEEHQHSEACYLMQTVCGEEECASLSVETISFVCGAEPHVHTSDCQNASGERICGIATEVFHTHNDFCYDGEENLICTLPGNAKHVHHDGCYELETQLTCQLQETDGHNHSDACKTLVAATNPACGLSESAGHVHGDTCYTRVLSCSLSENSGHVHEDACRQTESTLICSEEESPAHTHAEGCYNEAGEVTCGLEEGQGGHAHGEGCYESSDVLICGLEEGQRAHTHDDSCYLVQQTCNIAEGEGAHTHADACFPAVETITCGLEQGEGAHHHGEACYISNEVLICSLLHQHSSDCYQKDGSGRDCAVCGMDEVPEHNHSDACRQVTVETIEGHVHTDECQSKVLVCELTEHTHAEECYPQEEVVVTATPEATADTTDQVTVTPEPTTTPEPADTPQPAANVDDAYFCGIPEHRHAAECLDETGALICGYAQDHLHGELCLEELTDAVFYCGTTEHLHGYLCFDENLNLLCGIEPEHRHSYECLVDPAAIHYECGMEEHFHGELCYDENWNLICDAAEHLHDANCRYACGKPEHTHSTESSGGIMLLALEESFGCYDADGNLICTLEEHSHTDACNETCDSTVQASRNDRLMTLEETGMENTKPVSDFSQYINGLSVQKKYSTIYDAVKDQYTTAIDIEFRIPPEILVGVSPTTNFTYVLPEEIGMKIEKSFDIVSDGKTVGHFTLEPNPNGAGYYLDIHFTEIPDNTTGDGSLFFECTIDADATNDKGDIELKFDENIDFVVDAEEIKHTDSATALYSINAQKKQQDGKNSVYDAATNTLYYQVVVESKGTPDVIELVDQLNPAGLTVKNQTVSSVTLDGVSVPMQQEGTEGGYTYTANGNQMNITLPKVPRRTDGGTSQYVITYAVELEDLGYSDIAEWVNNNVSVTSGTSPQQVKDTAGHSENVTQTMLEKQGTYDENSDRLKWTIVFNHAEKDIAGLKLTDAMLSSLPVTDTASYTITPSDNGYKVLENADGTIAGIEFLPLNDAQNKTKYTITYETIPQKDFGGWYAESNTVQILDPQDNSVAEDGFTVENIFRKEQAVTKTVVAPEQNDQQMILDWTITIPIDPDGLSENFSCFDRMQPTDRHYMTYEQLSALVGKLDSMLAQEPAATIQAYTSPIGQNSQPQTINLSDLSLETHGSLLFSNLNFTLDANSEKVNTSKGSNIVLTYQSTAVTEGLTSNTYFGNEFGIGQNNASAGVNYFVNKAKPVTKYCGLDGGHRDTECGYLHSNNPFSWEVSIYQQDTYDEIIIEDYLPENVEPTEIILGQNWQSKLTYASPADGQTGDIPLTFTNGNDMTGLEVNGTYHPTTRKLTVSIKQDNDDSTTVNEGYFSKDRELKVKISARQTGNLPAPGTTAQYIHPNHVDVKVKKNDTVADYGSDDFSLKLQLSTPKRLSKTDMNWQEGTTNINSYNPNGFGWVVRLNPDTAYDQVVVTDTLPEGLNLSKIEVGNTVVVPTIDADGNMLFAIQNSQYESGLSIKPAYDPATRQLTITLDPEQGASSADLKGLGKALDIKYFFTIPETDLPSADHPNKELTYTNHASVDFVLNNTPSPETAEQTQKLNLTYVPAVTKYGVDMYNQDNANSFSIENSTGKLVWKVKVHQHEEYESITVQDTLPVDVIEPDFTNTAGIVQLPGHQYWLQVDHWSEDQNLCTLKFVNPNYTPDVLANGSTATYNASTGEISITLSGDYWPNNNVFGKDKDLWFTFYCKVKEDSMPNNKDGEYSKQLGEVSNTVSVTSNLGSLGTDTHVQNVTITQTKPDVETVMKQSPVYDDKGRLLHYQIDINPTQMDLDPEKNSITLIDKASYNQSDPVQYDVDGSRLSAERKLTLLPETVKLYYAQYDENGDPLMQGNRLLIGEEVDLTQWKFIYTEDDSSDWATRTMHLVVPDGRAMILVYDYLVSMNINSAYYNVPLGINNSVYVEKYESDQKNVATDSTIKWTSAGGGGVMDEERMTLIKHDASNQAYGLAGVVFKLSAYQNGTWTELQEYTTDANGQIIINPPDDEPSDTGVQMNTLYRMEEASTITGYDKPNPAPVRYFYWSEDDAPAIACPENFDLTAVPNLMTDTQVFYVENVRKSTEQQVQKLWEYSDGTQVESEYLPSSVTAVLRRYAIPVSQWDALVQQTGGKINGALEDPTEVNTSVTIIIQDAGKRNSISQTATAKVGSTLVFDVCVSNAGRHTPAYDKGEFEPYFTGYSANHSYREGFDWYRFTVPDVKENMVIAGGFRNIYYSNEWDGTFNIYNQYTGKTENCLEITNIKATVAMPPDHSTYVADLQEYIDRDYSVPIKLNAAGNWKGIWEDLHLEGEVPGVGKVHYKYYVTETPSNGYSNRVTGYSSDDGGTFVITNLKDGSRTMTTNLLVQKEWYDSNGVQYLYQGMDTNGYERWQLNDALYAYKDGQWYTVAGDSYTAFNGDTSNLPLPSVSVRLLRKNLLVSDAAWEPYIYNENDHTVINGNTGWMCKFINLPMALYDQNNDLKESYDYFIEELEQGDFTVELVSSGTETENGKTFEVIKVKNAAIRDVSVSVEKKWENDQIPENASVTLELSRWIVTKDGYELDETFAEEAKDRWETTINLPTDANLWSYQWKDLPNGHTADGVTKSYSYRVTETAVNGTPVEQTPYEVVYSQAEGRVPADGTLTITNKQAANETQIKVTKVWEDAAGNPVSDLPDDASVTLKLMRRAGENGTPEAVEGYQAVTLDGSTNWQTTISGLPMYLSDTNGTQTAYVYYFVEESVPAGYMVSYSNSKDGIAFTAPENGEVTVTNTATTVVSAEKVWKNSDGSDMEPPETNIQLQLYKVAMNQADWQQYVDGLQQSETPETPADPVVPEGQVMLTFALDSKNVVFGNLFYTCAIGEEPTVRITYNGSAEVQYMDLNLAGGTYVGSQGNSLEIPLKAADTQESHTITVKVSCTDPACVIDDWSISPVSSTSYALRSSGTFTPPPGTAIAVGDPVTLPDQGSWRYQWPEQASKAGDIYYAYYVGEITVPGYETAYDASYDQETGAYSFTVTNTKSEEVEDVVTTTELTIQKVWVNAADYKPDSITFQVTQTDTSNPDANAVNYPVVVNLTGETPVASCQALTDLGVVMELTPSTDGTDSWTLKLTNLPDTMREDGVLRYDYSYTVTENPVSGFESVRTGDETTGNYTFTNTLTALIVQKDWVGEEGEAVQFNLWRRKGGESTGTTCSGGCSTSVNASDEHKLLCGHYICQLSNYVESEHSVCECGYSYVCQDGHGDCGAAAGTVSMNVVVEFNNSNATTTYELNVGDRIIWMMRAPAKKYHPTEPTATYGSQTINFTIEGGVNAYDVDQDGFVEYISDPFEVLSAENGGTSLVYKAGFWNDDLLANAMLHEFIPAQQSTRSSMTPNSIDTTNAELYTGSPFTLSAATGWTYLFSGLDAVAPDGSPYQYFVEEVKVPDGYTVSYSHTDGISPDGGMLTITNIQNDEPDPVYLTVSKKWLDSDGKEMANQPQFYTVNYEIWAKQEQGEDTLFTQGQLPKGGQWSATYEVQPGESYYVKETGVLSGGNDMSALYEITYQAGENQGSATAEEVAITGGGSLTITNKLKPTYVLPETGGTGTYLYTGAGALLIGMALLLLYRNNQRKRRANE